MVRGSPNPRHVGFANRLRKARKQVEFTRRALEQKAGGTNGAVLYMETQKRLPTLPTVVRLASALDVSAGWLAYGLGEMAAGGRSSSTMGLGERLCASRMQQGFTKAALARLVGLSPSTVADIENGAQTSVEVAALLAHVLRISPSWLAFDEGPQVLPSSRRGRPSAQSSADAH